tara:strand:+ start:5864 stop:7105 length:1242 start_codon:yes stop_codon:yes gene_type:complete
MAKTKEFNDKDYSVTKVNTEIGLIQETELKLRLSSKTMALLIQHPLITNRLVGNWQTVSLYNQYFDTANLALNKADVALRLRKDGERVIQTLKGRGECVGGLFVRNEMDWYLDNYELNLELLACSCWLKVLANLDKRSIHPVFTNHFKRTKAILKWHWENQPVEVEVAFDIGSVESAGEVDDIYELELEMRKGPVEALIQLAIELASCFSLIPSSISKAERGYRLLKVSPNQVLFDNVEIMQNIDTLDNMIGASAKVLVSRLQNSIESIHICPDLDKLKIIRQQVVLTRKFIACLCSRVKSSDRIQFQSLLTTMENEIENLIKSNLTYTELASKCQECFNQITWGLLCLKLTKWYLLKEWLHKHQQNDTDYLQAHFYEWSKTSKSISKIHSEDSFVNFFCLSHDENGINQFPT